MICNISYFINYKNTINTTNFNSAMVKSDT